MSYDYAYDAQVAMGATRLRPLKAIAEAEAYSSLSLVIGYAPREMHSIKGGMTNCQAEMKEAVDCGSWSLFRFIPQLADEGENPFILESKEPKTEDYRKFMMGEARYSALTRAFPGSCRGPVRAFRGRVYQALRSPEAPARDLGTLPRRKIAQNAC